MKQRQILENGRNERLDFFRGMAMILVLLHHSGIPFGAYILAFHMPLFFALSGYTEHIYGGMQRTKFWPFVKKRFVRLMIPYFSFELINYIIWIPLCILRSAPIPKWDALYSILACINTESYMGLYGRLWFLPCMFVASIIFYGCLHCCKSKKNVAICCIPILGLSWVSANLLPCRLPFTLDTALLASFFLCIGYLLGTPIDFLLEKSKKYINVCVCLFCCAVLIFSVRFGGEMLMYVNRYGNYALGILGGLAGTFAFLAGGELLYELMKKFSAGKKLLLWYSQNSLAVFPVHLQVKCFFSLLFVSLGLPEHWIVMFALMLILTIPVVMLVKAAVPFAAGECKGKKTQIK